MAKRKRTSQRKPRESTPGGDRGKGIACRPHLLSLMPYPPGSPIEEVKRKFGLERVIKLASNENPLGPSPKAIAAMQRHAGELNLYPDGNAYYLRQALSRHLGVAPERLLFGNGSDELVILLALTFLAPRESIVVSQHSFIRYQMAAQLVGARWKSVPLLEDWRHDLRAMARAVTASTRMICLANPENPLGTMVGRREFERFLKAVPRRVMIVLDQAYFEYVQADDYFDGMEYVERYRNLVVLRTFSKAYGLAGLRTGYALAHPDVIRDVNRIRPPFNVNRAAQEAAVAALDDEEFLRRSVAVNEKGRARLCNEFDRLGLEYIPSQANFVLVRVGRNGCDGAAVTQELMRRGVIVRPMGGYGFPDHIRVTVGKPGENAAFVRALRKILR